MGDKPVFIALAGNPNVEKSNIFHALTGLDRQTRNGSERNETTAKGFFKEEDVLFEICDLPEMDSLLADEAEERRAKKLICFQKTDIVVVVLDAFCLERSLPLALHVMELTDYVVICLNIKDKEKKKQLEINVAELGDELGVPIICTNTREGVGILELRKHLLKMAKGEPYQTPISTIFSERIEGAISYLWENGEHLVPKDVKAKEFFCQVIEGEKDFYQWLLDSEEMDTYKVAELMARAEMGRRLLSKGGENCGGFREECHLGFLKRAAEIMGQISLKKTGGSRFTVEQLDDMVVSKRSGVYLLLLLLGLVFWGSIVGANDSLQGLMILFGRMGHFLERLMAGVQVPVWVIYWDLPPLFCLKTFCSPISLGR